MNARASVRMHARHATAHIERKAGTLVIVRPDVRTIVRMDVAEHMSEHIMKHIMSEHITE